jgi:hypothetical protein
MNDILLSFPVAGSMMWSIVKMFWPFLVFPIVLGIVFRVLEVLVKEKRFRYFLRKHRSEFFTFLFAIFGYIISYMFLKKPGVAFFLSVLITFIATIVLVYSKISERDFYFISLRRNVDREDWMGDGVFQYERVNRTFAITNSHSGFIYSKCLTWSDYVFDFEFKILNTSLGVILRATNLSNLIMMQIFANGIKAHIRINGFWQSWEPKVTNLSFEKNLKLDNWYRAKFYCDKGSIGIKIYDMREKLLFDRVWKIPSGSITFSYNPPKEIGLVAKSVISSIPFPINLEYGTIGFRNDGDEKALVDSVLVEKLQGIRSVN